MGYAQSYDKLTPRQSELLAKIATTATASGGEPVFLAAQLIGGTTEFDAIGGESRVFSSDWLGAKAALTVFEELGFIKIEWQTGGAVRFCVAQAALHYSSWHKRPRWQRWLSVKWDSWESDVRGGFITIVASIAASLAITVLTNLLLK